MERGGGDTDHTFHVDDTELLNDKLGETHICTDCCDVLERNRNLLDLPWDDILVGRIIPFLSLSEIFQLQLVSKLSLQLIRHYFSKCSILDFSEVAHKVKEAMFHRAVENSVCLRVLILKNCKDFLKDENFIPVVEQNPQLQKIDLTGCLSLTSQSIQAIANSCPALHYISVHGCHWVQAPALAVLAMNCECLQYVDLTSCWELDDETILVLIISHPGLKYLSLAKIYGITNVVIDMLARTCSAFEHLNIQGCWRITNSVIR
ncbi:uncharacterized protein LOC100372595 [Saccoglossus kowalevskii]|uniref:F-box/LRR-repeat protein 15-like n=1 Tax=Saccoglossus kowalevskii TaxID=10224 RepID=A0ABM0H0G4_SACKO